MFCDMKTLYHTVYKVRKYYIFVFSMFYLSKYHIFIKVMRYGIYNF